MMWQMIDHFGIQVADMRAAATFYDGVLSVLQHRRIMDFGEAIGYGTEQPQFWISNRPAGVDLGCALGMGAR